MHATRLIGATTHNLKSVSLELRGGELTCLTGVSGAGKSSLALDTLYAEGQRRFVESFSPYARQFLERLERPPVVSLDPVAAGVAVDRRAPVKSSRSTVATLADVEPYLSALFTREAMPVCPDCGNEAHWADARETAERLLAQHSQGIAVLTYDEPAPDTATFLQARERLLGEGFRRVWVEGEARELENLRPREATQGNVFLRVVVDRVPLGPKAVERLQEALEAGWRLGHGTTHLHEGDKSETLTRGLSCTSCGRALAAPRAGLFSYQSPLGACGKCRGFGRTLEIDWDRVVPDPTRTLAARALRCWSGPSSQYERRLLGRFCREHAIPTDVPWKELTPIQREAVLEGEGQYEGGRYPGVRAWFRWMEGRTYKMHVRVLLSRYRTSRPCAHCRGSRLNEAALAFRVGGLDLGDWHRLELSHARERLEGVPTRSGQGELARREVLQRLSYLERVGLGYLSLDRPARSLSGGEAQRVSLTAALGTALSGALFVLDEPTVGLHPSDVPPLVASMRELAERGNVALVVEHDPLVVRGADRVVELGPSAGARGGRILFDGTPAALAKRPDLPTGKVLAAVATPVLGKSRLPQGFLRIRGAGANNLVQLTVRVPLGVVCALTGPSGSGKSTLMEDVLYRTLGRRLGIKDIPPPGAVEAVDGGDDVKRVVWVDQSPLGRTSRGNAATYTHAWDVVRKQLAQTPDAQARGYTPAHFSFNSALGRCADCSGEGAETVEMQFLADVVLPCPGCGGKRFRPEILDVRLGGLSAADVLELSADDALDRFSGSAPLRAALAPLTRLGLGYLPLGQPLSTLSGGEAQRLKLARAMGEPCEGTLFLLDEPSAGLHAADVEYVVAALHGLCDAGASVLVVDHDVGVMERADWIIDLGPGGGRAGGRLVAEGTPEQVRGGDGRTAQALRREFEPPAASKGPLHELSPDAIEVVHAREHNLQNISCRIPRGKLTVVTGPSGSGKSTLAFDVVFAEGQRRFVETLTPYARQFLPMLPRPDVERVRGIPPSVALEQRTSRAGATSTVATVTEVAHYLRLLFAKLGSSHCPRDGTPITPFAPDALLSTLKRVRGTRKLLAPVVQARKGTYGDVFAAAARAGIVEAYADGERVLTDNPPRLARSREHDISLIVHEGTLRELKAETLDAALRWGKGEVVSEAPNGTRTRYSTARSCSSCGTAAPEMDPRWFSFNTAQGRCPDCEGTGVVAVASQDEGESSPCPACSGERLAPYPRAVRLEGLRYPECVGRPVARALDEVRRWRFTGTRAAIGAAALGELVRRLEFLVEVGLGYLTLDRAAATLSGGEMQRLRLSAQLGAGLTGALYVLDEPTIGLHPRDTARLLGNLRGLVETGSTVLVVEHDVETLRGADYLLDLGPSGGRGGGRLVAAGPPSEVLAHPESPTGAALRRTQLLLSPPRPPVKDWLSLRGARAHNLKNVNLRLPLGRLTVVAGVSGSGKSTLVRRVLLPAVCERLGRVGEHPGTFEGLEGVGTLRRAVSVDQSPIGRTPRSVPATFLGIFDEIRRLFAGLPESRARGFAPARFSFNSTAGGRCPLCEGQGSISHEMSFLPDVTTLCEVCLGARFEPATLEVRYRGLSIGEVLRLSADEASELFVAHPKIAAPLRCLAELGVGYLQLGQGSPSLSGGEAQRLKLASELTATQRHEATLYVLDEPTTGLHLSDVEKLIRFLWRLVDRGDTVVVIEHHPSLMVAADHLVELGPEGGEEGGRIVAQGTPREVAARQTATAAVLRDLGLATVHARSA